MTIEQSLEQAATFHRAGQFAQAEQLYRGVLSQQPDHPDALHLLGVLAHQIGRNTDAADLIRRAITLRPDAAVYYTNWGAVLGQLGRVNDAIAAQRHAISLDPSSADAHNNLGRTYMRASQPADAARAFEAALAIQPNDAEVLANLGNAARQLGQLDHAIDCCRRSIRIQPNFIAAYNNLGAALHQKGQFEDAIETYQRAIAIEPGAADVHHNLGIALHRAGQFDQSIQSLARAAELQPERAESHHQLAYVLRERGHLDEATTAARRATNLDPRHADAHNNLGIILCEKGITDEAITAFRRAIDLRPDFGGAYNNLGNALKDTGQIDEAIKCYCHASEFDAHTRVYENLLYGLHFHPGYNARQIAVEHARWNDAHAKPLAAHVPPCTNDKSPDRRVRIGYVSPDLREHPVGRFLLPLLTNHDHEQFEVFCYTDLARPDSVTDRLKAHADVWRPTAGLSDELLAQRIREDRIDILVDLAMHMDGTRMLTLRKPAPIQITYLAYCSTTGLHTMDYRLTDPHLDPPGIDESIYSEKSIRLPQTYWCYQPPAIAPPVSSLPAATNRYLTFASLNNFGKVSQTTLDVWSKLMASLPGSICILHAGEGAHRKRVQSHFARFGVDPGRVRFVGKIPLETYFAQYGGIDIALDPFPYPGGTTTCDALYMGVPVITLAGPSAASRGGVSILQNVGLADFIASTPEQYIHIAVQWASDLARLSELRKTLRGRMARSPLMDAPRFARDVEAAYRQVWKAWCAGGNG